MYGQDLRFLWSDVIDQGALGAQRRERQLCLKQSYEELQGGGGCGDGLCGLSAVRGSEKSNSQCGAQRAEANHAINTLLFATKQYHANANSTMFNSLFLQNIKDGIDKGGLFAQTGLFIHEIIL